MNRCENGMISTWYPSGADSSKLPTLSPNPNPNAIVQKGARIGAVLVKDLEVILQVTAIQSMLEQIRSAMKQLMGMRSVE